jgi:hypothetical protein
LVPKDRKPPSLKNVENMVMITRALALIRKMRFRGAIGVVAQVWDPRAYIMAINWLLRQYYPRRFSSIARTVIWRDEKDMEKISIDSAPVANL